MPGRIVTFYSYKGGTGRSMSLANTAWVLASNGLRVLVVDWDLEAPGLHRWFHPFLPDPALGTSVGLIDLIWEFATAAVDPTASAEPGWHREYARISPYAMSVAHDFPGGGTVDLVPAGRQDSAYSALVGTFDWDNFYHRLGGGGFIEALMEDMRSHYDYVLVDSRTGLSDTAGICTVQLPDVLVACFSMSAQAIEGTAAVATSVEHQRADSPPTVFPVPMRVEDGEKAMREASLDSAREHFDRFLHHVRDPDRYWGDVEVPYRAYYAYEEVLATLADRPNTPASVLAATERLVGYLTGGRVTRAVPTTTEAQTRELLSRFHRAERDELDGIPREGARVLPERGSPEVGVAVVHLDGDYSRGDDLGRGRAYLAGGMPRAAADLLRPLATGPGATDERRYYFALSLLSGRSPADLELKDLAVLGDVLRPTGRPTRFWDALAVVVALATGEPGAGIAVTAWSGLPPERRSEITRHLWLFPLPDRSHDEPPPQAARERVEAFFEPPPVAPTRPEPRSPGRSGWEPWLVGALGLLASALSGASAVGADDVALPLGAAVASGAAGALALGRAVGRLLRSSREPGDVPATGEPDRRAAPRLSDREIAELLDHHKRRLAARAGGEATGTIVLLHPAPGARAARVLHGPPRYSAYSVLVLRPAPRLVRMVRADVDLVSGAVTNERRSSFRYDSLVSVMSTARVDARGELVRTLRLGLVDGDLFEVVVTGAADPHPDEDADRLLALAMEVSGVTAALPVLERAVADGRLDAPSRIGQESRSTGPDPRLA